MISTYRVHGLLFGSYTVSVRLFNSIDCTKMYMCALRFSHPFALVVCPRLVSYAVGACDVEAQAQQVLKRVEVCHVFFTSHCNVLMVLKLAFSLETEIATTWQ